MEILKSSKYADLGIPIETVVSLLNQERQHFRSPRVLEKAVRKKLHNIIAPYLDELDYSLAQNKLEEVFCLGDQAQRDDLCLQFLACHASTRERLLFQEEFYKQIFSIVGYPETILDLACGLQPLAFPWMGLPAVTQYYAYDIHQPRIDLINRFFQLQGLKPLAEKQDILLFPPDQPAQVAFLFKEAHRMEARQRGCSRRLWQALHVRFLLVSLPVMSLSGKHDLTQKHRNLVKHILGDLSWNVSELQFPNELVFILEKGHEI